MITLEVRLRRAAAVLDAWHDVLAERPDGAAPPAWVVDRGWAAWLADLADERLERLEREGAPGLVGEHDAPEDLRAFAARVVEVTGAGPAGDEPRGPRKRAQVEALVARCRGLGLAPARAVDLGAGRGELTRALAAGLGVPAVGLERDAALVRRARASTHANVDARFEQVDVTAAEVAFAPGDLVVGLHACGALGDALVAAAARDRAHVLLVACCPQKVRAPARAPLSALGRALALDVPRAVLGLANAPDAPTDPSRRLVRHALRSLLRARGVGVAPGDETRGVAPRAWRDLERATSLALAARGLPPATPAERALAHERAREDLARARRWALPRRLLGGVLEVALALDRGRALEEAGAAVEVGPLFPRALSPRNVSVVARAPA